MSIHSRLQMYHNSQAFYLLLILRSLQGSYSSNSDPPTATNPNRSPQNTIQKSHQVIQRTTHNHKGKQHHKQGKVQGSGQSKPSPATHRGTGHQGAVENKCLTLPHHACKTWGQPQGSNLHILTIEPISSISSLLPPQPERANCRTRHSWMQKSKCSQTHGGESTPRKT